MKAVGIYLVVLELKEKPTKTKGGLLLTDKIKEDIRYRKGIVKSVGEMVQGVKTGDEIYYDKHAGFDLTIDNELYKVIKQPDIILVV